MAHISPFGPVFTEPFGKTVKKNAGCCKGLFAMQRQPIKVLRRALKTPKHQIKSLRTLE